MIALFILLAFIVSLSESKASSSDGAPYIFAGIEYDNSFVTGDTLFCNSRKEAANIGIGKTIYMDERIEINAQWTHHSCVGEYRDKNTYDGIGAHVRVKLW